MTAITPADLRASFPEFSDETRYPDAQITLWAAEADRELSIDRFGDSRSLASMLFVAHNLMLSAQNVKAASVGSGSNVGTVNGPVSSKSVGGVSKGIDVGASQSPNAGTWNLTTYGQRLYRMMRQFGLGPVVAVPCPTIVGPFGAGVAPPYLGYGWPY